MSQSLTDIKMEDTDASNRKLLQQLQNISRVKSEQLETVVEENEKLWKEIGELKSKFNQQVGCGIIEERDPLWDTFRYKSAKFIAIVSARCCTYCNFDRQMSQLI